MKKTVFRIDRMDCPCEENLLRMKLESYDNIEDMIFDLEGRIMTIYHSGDYHPISDAVDELALGSHLIETIEVDYDIPKREDRRQRKYLWIVLAINFGFFLVEMTTGIISSSMGLVADSLDMLADAFVYGLSLLAVGASVTRKKKVAMFCGYLQLLLAFIGFVEVIRRFVGIEEMPNFQTMIGVSVLALAANVVCLYLLQRTRSKDAHIQASVICSSNDVITNSGVIVAGILVWQLKSGLPDLIIGIIVFTFVMRGAFRILKLAK